MIAKKCFYIKECLVSEQDCLFTGRLVFWMICDSDMIPLGKPLYSWQDAIRICDWLNSLDYQEYLEVKQINRKLLRKNND